MFIYLISVLCISFFFWDCGCNICTGSVDKLQISPLLRTFSLTPISSQRCLSFCCARKHTNWHTLAGMHILTLPSLLWPVTHTLVFPELSKCWMQTLSSKYCHMPPEVSGSPREPSELLAQEQVIISTVKVRGSVTWPKWSWVESPRDNDQRSVFWFASHMESVDLRKTGCSQICLCAPVWKKYIYIFFFGLQWLPDMVAQIIGCWELHNEPQGL